MKQLSVVLPVHNEESIISSVFSQIHRMLSSLGISFECILVENGSSDKTFEKIKKITKEYNSVRILVAPKGYGSAVLAGLAVAAGTYVCYMPSDGQIDLAVFPLLWKEIQTKQWDMVKIRRISRESWDRTVVSKILSVATSLFFGIQRLDINGSPRIFARRHLKTLQLRSIDSFIDVEFAVKASRLGWKIKEIPMNTLPRSGGVSTRSWKTYWEFIRNIISFWMRTLGQDFP